MSGFSSANRRAGNTRRPILRILQIHDAIHSGRHPNCETLALQIEVTPKTILRDISFMRDEMNLPIEYHPVKHGYHYTGPVSGFPLLRLNKRDLMALFLSKKALEPMRGTRLERMLAESLEKIAGMCEGEVAFQWQDLDHLFSVTAAGVVEADVTLFSDLTEAVQECREVSFQYHKLTASRAEKRQVQPFLLRQVEHVWYLVGRDLKRRAVRTFALQRIHELKVLKIKFQRPPDSEINEHLRGSFGVWSYVGDDSTPALIRIRFTGYAARIIAERQWHPTQEIIPGDPKKGNSVELRLQLRGLEEIIRWVLSWGPQAEVLEPEILRIKIIREIQRMAGIYRREIIPEPKDIAD